MNYWTGRIIIRLKKDFQLLYFKINQILLESMEPIISLKIEWCYLLLDESGA